MFIDIDRKNVSIKRFETNKTFSFTNNDSGSGFFSFPIIKGTDSNLYDYDTTTDAMNLG